jgi:beta-lactamase regulating signal transducer with metallopeptidase domain
MIRAVIASTIVLGLAGFIATLAHRASASVRHAIWFVGLATALGVGALAIVGPFVEVESILVKPRSPSPDSRLSVLPGIASALPRAATADARLSSPDARVTNPDSRFPIRDSRIPFALAIWLIGAVIIIARSALAHLALARLVDRSRHLDADLRLDVDASIDVRLSADVDGPFTLGAVRPVILLPLEAQYWTSERLRIVLVHEAAHVARLDYVAQLVGTVACAAYWFNPIAWLAAARLRAEAEHAADDRVLAAGVDGVTYASHLLELARPESALLSTAMAIGMARGTTRLEKRFTAMLDSGRSRGIVPLRLQAAIGSAAMLIAVPFTSLRLVPVAPRMAPVALAAPAPLAVVAPAVIASTNAGPVLAISRVTTPSVASADTIVDRTIAAAAGETISIILRNGGGIDIRAWDQPQVRVHAVLSGTQATETRVMLDRVGDGVELRAVLDEQRRNSSNSNRFEISVPSRFNVHISSGGGSIAIAGVEGRFSGETGGGEITLDGVKGTADLSTGGGEVHVRNSSLEGSVSTGGGEAVVTNTSGGVRVSSGSGPVVRTASKGSRVYGVYGVGGLSPRTSVGNNRDPLIVVDGTIVSDGAVSFTKAGGAIRLESVPNGGTFTTGGGSIDIGSVGGAATFTTGGGDVRIADVSDDISVSTGAGSVEISVINGKSAARNIAVTSGSGRIVIDLPPGLDARFDLETAYTERNGPTKIESDFPVNVTETQDWDSRKGTPRRYVRASGSAGSGRGLIKIRTVNGNIVLRRR